MNQTDSALHYAQESEETNRRIKAINRAINFEYSGLYLSGSAYAQSGDNEMAEIYFKKAIAISYSIKLSGAKLGFCKIYIPFLLNNNRVSEAFEQAKQLFNLGKQTNNNQIKLVGAGFMRQVFDTLHQTDSAYYYSRMEAKLNAEIFSQNNVNKIQSLAFNEQIRVMEDAAKKSAEDEQHKQNIQFELMALGIITFIILFLLLSNSIVVNEKWISFFGILGLLIVFEFINLLIHPFLEGVTHHTPVLMLLALVLLASLLIPLHHRMEKWIKEKMTEKNKKIRLANAKNTIEKLEKKSEQF